MGGWNDLKKANENTGVLIFGPATLVGIIIPARGNYWTIIISGCSLMATAFFAMDRSALDYPWYFPHDGHIGEE